MKMCAKIVIIIGFTYCKSVFCHIIKIYYRLNAILWLKYFIL